MTILPLRSEQDWVTVAFDAKAVAQAMDALDDLALPPTAYKHLPWPSLDAIIGGIGPGKLWYLPMYSGTGKTSILASLCESLVMRGDRVYCLPMESTPVEWMRHLACRQIGIDPGNVATGRQQERSDWPTVREELAHVYRGIRGRYGEWANLCISDAPDFNAETITAALEEAAEFRADWVIVDHVDHLGLVEKQSEYQVSFHGNKAMRDVGKDLGLRILASSQLKDGIGKTNPLERHMLPPESMIKWGAHKRELATGMIGGCWPLRMAGVSKEELQAYRDRRLKARDVCEPDTVCLGVMKHRDLGKHWGEHVYLRVQNGKVEDIGQEWYTSQMQHGIYTASRL